MTEIFLDGLEIETIADVHALFSQTLELPSCYGKNLDALFDCLTEISQDTVIQLRHPSLLELKLGQRGRALTALLRRAEEENPHIALVEEKELF